LYTENTGKDLVLFGKAFLSNQLAKFAPKLYVRLTHQTGRGEEKENAAKIASYFIECFHDYRDQLGLKEEEFELYLKDKVILEYGPGDILGASLLFYAYGVKAVHCVDKFPLSNMSNENVDVYVCLLNSLSKVQRKRAEAAFNEKENIRNGFKENCISYKVTKNGLSEEINKYDLIVSRAVLEHVNNLKETMLDIKRSMKNSGISLHQVDLKSHGLDRYIDFDFLTWPKFIYNLMYCHKGFPNRWRVNKYKELAESSKLNIKKLIHTGQLDPKSLNIVSRNISNEFKDISPQDLSWLGFWLHLEQPSQEDPVSDKKNNRT